MGKRKAKPKWATVGSLIDYLRQFDPELRVVATEADVDEPCDFVVLDSAVCELDAAAADDDFA